MAISKLVARSKIQKKIWDAKRKLAEKKLMDLTHKTKNVKEEFENVDMLAICYEKAKVNTNSGPLSCVGFSTSVMERAQEVQANLGSKFPSFTKLMLTSHVTGGFWLGLPIQFCRAHLPNEDKTVVLVDEDEQSYDTKYLADKNGLSGGWKYFSLEHELVEGDVIVFQLIRPCKFKVYIVRPSKLTEVDGGISLPNLDSANSDSETMEGIKFSESIINFKDVKSFKDFTIHVHGVILDSEIPTHLRKKYYKLCCSQNMFLHDSLIEGLNGYLAMGMISETISIAEEIRAVKSTTPLNHLETWDKTLKAFEDLGMVVGFLRARIHTLLSLSESARAIIESKTNERNEAVEDMQSIMEKLDNVRELIRRLDAEIVKEKELDFMFEVVSGASW